MPNQQLAEPRAFEDVPPHAAVAPSRVRYGVLTLLCTLALLLYIDRVCIGQAATKIREDLGLSKTQMGWVFTAFSLAYALFEVPAGHWGDRHGSRGVIARIVICWSLFTALTGAAVGLGSLLLVRFLFGAGEAGAFPNAARVVTRWFPHDGRGRVRGAITFVSLVGAAVAPPMSAMLIQRVGWRFTFAIFGALGVAWAAAFYAWFRDEPAAHPRVNASELALIHAGDVGSAEPAVHPAIPWRTVLTSPNVWLLGLIMTVSSMLFYVMFQWLPTYLKEALRESERDAGWMTGMVMSGGAVGCLAGGWVADRVVRRATDRKWGRRLSGAGALLCAAASVLAVRRAESAATITACLAAALFFMQAGVPMWWSVVAETSGRHGAALWGLMNSMASLGLMAVTVLIGWFVDRRQHGGLDAVRAWALMFDVVGLGLLAGAACWMFVDASRSSVERNGVAV